MSFETLPEFLMRRVEESQSAAARSLDPKIAFIEHELAKRYRDALDGLKYREDAPTAG